MKLSLVAGGVALLLATAGSDADSRKYFSQVATIPLATVGGRIDHFAIDLKGARLFVCALGNNSVEVLSLDSNAVIHSLRGLSEPQGVSYVPEVNRIYVTNAGSGECDVFEGTSYSLLRRIDLGGDADNIHYDASAHRMLVSAGNGIGIIDISSDSLVGKVELPGHPEGFVFEEKSSRVFVNVPLPSRSAFVVDRARIAVTDRWPIGGPLSDAFSNFPISLDETRGRLFVGTRVPALLKVIDVSSGKIVADLGIDGDADDISYDSKRQRMYVSCGTGFLDVFQQLDPDHYKEAARVPTAAGGRTSLWVPEMNRLFIAIPRRGSQVAEIRVYEAE